MCRIFVDDIKCIGSDIPDVPAIFMNYIDGFVWSRMSVQIQRIAVVYDAVSEETVGALGNPAQLNDFFQFGDGKAVVQQDASLVLYASAVCGYKSVGQPGKHMPDIAGRPS